jgi:hypothetical protein
MLVKRLYCTNCKENAKLSIKSKAILLLIDRLMNQVVTTTPTIGSNVEEVEYKNLKFVMWVL